MEFEINCHTVVCYEGGSVAVRNAVGILRRDLRKKLGAAGQEGNRIVLRGDDTLGSEEFYIEAADEMTVFAGDDLGFVYGLLFISEKFLGIAPFWFWMDQKIDKVSVIPVKYGQYRAGKPIIKYRGWFINDEVLIMKWKIDGDPAQPWRMVFEALLRCGGNMVIPGTDKNSKIYRQMAADMGLWITHHHAEPLGAEMFVRRYPDREPNYAQAPELFHALWEEGIQAQKDYNVIWSLGFRGQGDCPFWEHDSSGCFDTPEKRGKLIGDVIELQRELVLKYVEHPVLCTNLYGEIMELYEQGYLKLHEDIIKIYADNGFGKMVTRRQNNHTARLSSLPKEPTEHGGIYYHVSFYDLQAANHITMLPNSVDFVDRELTEVAEMNMTDYWIVNCSNIRPHAYYLDAIRKKWFGETVGDVRHSRAFAECYFQGSLSVAEMYRDYPSAMTPYGTWEDEHAGEQFYTENVRLLVHEIFNGKYGGTARLNWLVGEHALDEQIKMFTDICRRNFANLKAYYRRCQKAGAALSGDMKTLFDATLFLQVSIHYYCTAGVIAFGDGYRKYREQAYKDAFLKFGDSAEAFYSADRLMRAAEYGVWRGFYANDCFADIKHTAYMVEKMMGYVRELGDNAGHDLWYRDAVYAPCDRRVLTLLVNDNHMTDWELYQAFREKRDQKGTLEKCCLA